MHMLGVSFTVLPSGADETVAKMAPREMVEILAKRKAEDIFFGTKEDVVVIGADTVVSTQDGTILGKPKDVQDAARMLRCLSGSLHSVSTGVAVCVRKNGEEKMESFVSEATVWMDELSEAEIAAYLATGEPMDKAGAYGIQGLGARFIRAVKGDYYTVVGLPVHELYKKLKELHVISV